MLSRSSDWQNGVGFAQHATSGICTGPPVGCIKKKSNSATSATSTTLYPSKCVENRSAIYRPG